MPPLLWRDAVSKLPLNHAVRAISERIGDGVVPAKALDYGPVFHAQIGGMGDREASRGKMPWWHFLVDGSHGTVPWWHSNQRGMTMLELRNLSVLSYVNAFTLWHYRSRQDLIELIEARSYFDDVNGGCIDTLRMNEGDMILAVGTSGARLLVVTVAAPGIVRTASVRE